MIFDELDQRMRVFETAADYCVLPGLFMVARLDGRGFTRLTKEVCQFEAPFDERFRDLMTATCESLMDCGFHVVYAFTESDEISLLFALGEQGFGRKLRKYTSLLAGEASAQFSLRLQRPATFDCRMSQLPSAALVVDYFRWRQEDAVRNALNAHCYWMLRREGVNERQATGRLLGLSIADKNELLFQRGVQFNDLPAWQKRGVGLWWERYDKVGVNPLTGAEVIASRRRLKIEYALPMRDRYSEFIAQHVAAASGSSAGRESRASDG